ncbi:glycoside hydrolase family 26 protein [Streptomyces sp. NPDC020965]|uniref:glycoside hydrolase family 26 protein n=1 Tax=Streptomyces sp. NPDC020965 TaxID=3365105 RepID=UPI003797E7BF
MRRRTFLAASGTAPLAAMVPSASASASVNAAAAPPIAPKLTARDPQASRNAQAVYAHLVASENAARAGNTPMTIIGQHIEAQNELYNPRYGDTGGATHVGYYYNKARAITGRLPGFVEIDLGPGYGSGNGWGIATPRSYNQDLGLPSGQRQWRYVDDAIDLAFGIWKGLPRAEDGTYNHSGTMVGADGRLSAVANGGAAAGMVGVSFHQPYPGSSLKDFSQVLTQVTDQRPGGIEYYPPATINTDQAWFDRVVDWAADTPQYRALLADLEILAANLSYFAAYDIPVLLRPYHEMNGPWFWWGGKTPTSYKKLWSITYDYLVKTKGLHNLIFVWSPNAWTPNGTNVPWDYYPGAGRVDIVAVDDYNAKYGSGVGTPENQNFTNIYYTGLVDYAKPRMLAETGYVPITAPAGAAPATNALTASPWVIWSVWGDRLTASNSNADVKATYYATSQVWTGGSGTGYGQNFNWGSIHAH